MIHPRVYAYSIFSAGLLATSAALATPFSQSALPPSIQVPAGHSVAWETVGKGYINYECKQTASGPEWVFAGPKATLTNREGEQVGTYVGPPATWAANDGSKLTATQIAVAPAGEGNIPYQLVKANPAIGKGLLTDVTYIQRVALEGGAAPDMKCKPGEVTKATYKADYIFWKAN